MNMSRAKELAGSGVEDLYTNPRIIEIEEMNTRVMNAVRAASLDIDTIFDFPDKGVVIRDHGEIISIMYADWLDWYVIFRK